MLGVPCATPQENTVNCLVNSLLTEDKRKRMEKLSGIVVLILVVEEELFKQSHPFLALR